MSDAAAAGNTPASNSANQEKRRRALTIFGIVLLIAAIAYVVYWFFVAHYREYTDDAYVAGNLVQVSAQSAGTVISIGADETDLVQRGTPLIKLNTADATVALQRASAQLGDVVRQVNKLFISTRQFEAGVTLGEIGLVRAQQDQQRREGMEEPGAISKEDIEHARQTTSFSEAGLALAQAQLSGSRALVANTDIVRHPQVQAAAAQLRDAYLALQRTSLTSPVSGYVARRAVQVGQHVNAGETLMAVFPTEEVWIDANFKEVQLRHLRIGQPVKVTADIYGDDVVYHGTVVGLGLGTGAAFSLLPAQNATGNWIKVVQRLPVRIELQPEDVKKHPLRIGLSMAVTVDTHQRDGAVLATSPRTKTAYRTDIYDRELEAADRLIEDIIKSNLIDESGRAGAESRTRTTRTKTKTASAQHARRH
jgi:membrane fusion protein (multidrug efflux system)